MSARPASSFARDVTKLVGGTGLAQVVGIAAAPILTRLYAPDAWGVAAVFASVVGTLTVVACLRYELAILLPKDDEGAANVFGATLLATVATAAACVGILFVAGSRLPLWLGAPGLEPYLWLIPASVFVAGIYQAITYWCSRARWFGRVALVRTLNSAVTNVVQIGLAFFAGHAGGLIWGVVVGSVAATAVLAWQFWSHAAGIVRFAVSRRGILDAAWQYRRFPIYDAGGSLLSVVSQSSPVFVLGHYFSQTVVGHYALAMRLIYLPMSFIGGAVSQVFFQRAAESHAHGEPLAGLTEDVVRSLVTMSVLPSLLLAIAGRDLFMLVFGAEWADAGRYAQLLAPWMCFWFVGSPLTSLFAVLQRMKTGVLVHIIFFVTRVVPLIAAGLLGSADLALALFSLVGVLTYAAIGGWALSLAGASSRAALLALGSALRRAVPAAVAVLVITLLPISRWIVLAAAAAALVEHAWFLIRSDRRLLPVLGFAGSAQ